MGKTIAYLHHQWSPEQIASYIPVSLHLIYRCNRKSIQRLIHRLRKRIGFKSPN